MIRHFARSHQASVAALALTAALAACGSDESERRAAVEIRGTNPTAGVASAAAPARPTEAVSTPDASGVIDHGSYQSVVAQGGDTVADVAQRVGLSASELAAYNGLTPAHSLRAGDELVLPQRPQGYAGSTEVAAAPATSITTAPSAVTTIDTAPLDSAPAAASTEVSAGVSAATVAEAPTDGTLTAPQPPSATAARESWSPDLAAAAIARSSGLNADGTLAAPPSSAAPLPAEPEPRQELQSPDLGQYQTGATGSPTPPPSASVDVAAVTAAPAPSNVRLLRPVEGPVAIGFNKGSGPSRNDGVDFAAPAGTSVVAAADGEVALVSQSLGGLGTIVLLRHPNDLLTVYGRIDGVTVRKGQVVQAGQPIGVVSDAAAPAEPRMHFEVRRGAESLDPMQFL